MLSQGFFSWIARKQSLLQLPSFFLCLIASEASNYLSEFLFLEAFPDNDNSLIARIYELLSWIPKKKMKG